MYYCGPRPRKEHCMLAWSYVLPDICRPIPRRIESFGKIGKTLVFSYKPTICWKNPGFSPKSRVNLGFAFEPEKFLGFRRLGYIYIYETYIFTKYLGHWIIPAVATATSQKSPRYTSKMTHQLPNSIEGLTFGLKVSLGGGGGTWVQPRYVLYIHCLKSGNIFLTKKSWNLKEETWDEWYIWYIKLSMKWR